jgi:orotate phosphoribosyltransferase
MRVTQLFDNQLFTYWFYVIKQLKSQGLQRKIEGNLIEPVVIVDDVLTKSSSVMQALEAVMNEGFNVVGVVLVIDREEKHRTI